nr:proteoglycan 4-like isoform X1 [Anas platyrhynchos]XP_038028009.1 proteoglycan 4-like isoform X1 [Anas platyrhynchos]
MERSSTSLAASAKAGSDTENYTSAFSGSFNYPPAAQSVSSRLHLFCAMQRLHHEHQGCQTPRGPQGHVRKEQMAATAESRGTALQAPASILAPLQARPQQDNRPTPSHAAARSQRPRVQLRVQRHYAPPSSVATPARTAQVPATKTEKMPATRRRKDGHAREDTRAAAGISKPGGRQQKEATWNLHWDPDAAHQQGPGSPHSTGRDSAREAVSPAQSASLAMSGPTNAEPADSAQVAGPASEGDKNPMGASAPRDAKSPSPLAAAMPGPSTSSQKRPPTLKDRVKINWDIYGCSSFRPAMQIIPSGEREGCQLSRWNESWPSSVKVPRLRRIWAADDGDTADSTAASASGRQEVAVRTAGQRLPYFCSTTSKTILQDIQEEWEESPRIEAVAEADDVLPGTSPAPSGEADARPSAAPMAAVPGPEELPPACMPKEGKASASPLAAAMPGPSTSSQKRPPTLKDRVKINWDIYGCSSFRPAMQIIPSGEREGCQLSRWNESWPSSVKVPRLRRIWAADDGDTADSTAASASGRQEVAVRTAGQRLPYFCSTTSKTILQDIQEEWEESPRIEAVAEADDVLPSTSPAPSGEADARPSAAPMAAVPGPEELPPACMPKEGKASASPLAAHPVLEARTAPLTPSACEEEEAAPSPLAGGLLQEVSKVYLPRPTVMEATDPCRWASRPLIPYPSGIGGIGARSMAKQWPTGLWFSLPMQVSSEHRSSAQCSSHFQSVPEEGPGMS